jgi:hypothetical protein
MPLTGGFAADVFRRTLGLSEAERAQVAAGGQRSGAANGGRHDSLADQWISFLEEQVTTEPAVAAPSPGPLSTPPAAPPSGRPPLPPPPPNPAAAFL